MSDSTPIQPLTEDELDRLDTILDSIGPGAMNIEMLDGYFCALISGPDVVMPSEYLPQVWGDDATFQSDEQANDVIGLVMRHWDTVASELQRSLSEETHIYMPVLLEDETGVAHCNDWAEGFLCGTRLRQDSWLDLIYSEEYGGTMLIIMLFAYENDPDPELRSPAITEDKREDLVIQLIAALAFIYRHFEPHRRNMAHHLGHTQRVRTVPKIGRNAPCPCGSGRKYKHCCISGASMPH
jgi:uncharacterized protein